MGGMCVQKAGLLPPQFFQLYNDQSFVGRAHIQRSTACRPLASQNQTSCPPEWTCTPIHVSVGLVDLHTPPSAGPSGQPPEIPRNVPPILRGAYPWKAMPGPGPLYSLPSSPTSR